MIWAAPAPFRWSCGTPIAVSLRGSRPPRSLNIRFVVTSIETGSAEHIYETLYCARGQAENLIKLHKAQLASDRTSCRSSLANQMRAHPAHRRVLVDAHRP